MRILLTILIIVLILSLLGLIPVMYVRGNELAQRPREGGTFGLILNDHVYTLDMTSRTRRQVVPYYREYSPWQRYESQRQFNRYDSNRFNYSRGYRSRYYRGPQYHAPRGFEPYRSGFRW